MHRWNLPSWTQAVLTVTCLACSSPRAARPPARSPCAAPPAPSTIAPPSTPSDGATPPRDDGLGQRAIHVVRQAHGPEWKALHRSFSEQLRASIPEAAFHSVMAHVEAEVGALQDVRLLAVEEVGPLRTFHCAAFFERGTRKYRVTLDAQGSVHGLFVTSFVPQPEVPTAGPADAYISERRYSLPCRGQWVIGNGGRSRAVNHHVGNTQQWYAYDLVRKDPATGKTHRGEGTRNEDYLAWKEPVLAPADGKVVQVVDGIHDHGVDHTDRYFLTGNLITIEHGPGEYSFIAHLRKGSIVVKPGQRVKQGQLLGETGNSGNSTEPHIHWHLATEPDISRGHGLPIRLRPMKVNGQLIESPEPVRDQAVEP